MVVVCRASCKGSIQMSFNRIKFGGNIRSVNFLPALVTMLFFSVLLYTPQRTSKKIIATVKVGSFDDVIFT